ncbi:MAG: STAS domain-containing protein [Nocardioides sp.]|uniref:STAS domain-containing protein n=1 Tax=Nocardioides sp. TaxID=35761 RepID=UPI003F0B11A3
MDITTDGTTVVLRGEFDGRSTSTVRAVIYDQLHASDHVVLDMREVEALDLIALRVLLVATRQAWRDGRRLTLRDCSPTVLRMIHLARVSHAVDFERQAA